MSHHRLRKSARCIRSPCQSMGCHAMPKRFSSSQYRGLSPHVNAMPELSLLCHSGSFVRNARANHAHLSIAYPLPFFALPCRPQLRSYHRLSLTHIAATSMPLQSLRIFPLPPLSVALHRLCALLSQCRSVSLHAVRAHAYRVAVSLRRCFSCRSSPVLVMANRCRGGSARPASRLCPAMRLASRSLLHGSKQIRHCS